MTIFNYVFVLLVLLTLNEYRLIKKYIRALEPRASTKMELLFQKFIRLFTKPLVNITKWINYHLLNNELNY